MAFLHLRHARAFAAAADTANGSEPDAHARRQAEELLAQAEDTCTPRARDDDPTWIPTFGPAELAAELGFCCQRIGQHQRAANYADQALAGSASGYQRSIQFDQVHAAQARLPVGMIVTCWLPQAQPPQRTR